MASLFRIPERFKNKPSSGKFLGVVPTRRSSSRSPSPAPSGSRIPRSPSPLPNAQCNSPTPTPRNEAFEAAVKRHLQSLSPEEQQAFNNNNAITPEALIAQIKSFDDDHSRTSRSRQCAARVEGFLTAVDGYLKPVSIMAAHSPEITSLVVGGVKLIVQLGLRFVAFFNRLTEMMEHLAGHLGYLSQYAGAFAHSTEVQKALSRAYRDLLKFCRGARNVFIDSKGNTSRWTSFRIFFRVTWEPFEANFDALDSEFRDHVNIVIRTAGIVEHERLRCKEDLEAQEKEDRGRRELLLWLSGLEFEQDHDRIFKKRHGDTGNWLVESEKFNGWLDTQKRGLLWCHGNPGVGKSVLASLVLEKVSARHALNGQTGIAFVYFNHQDQGVQKCTKIVSEIIKQLSRQKKVLPEHLKQFYKQYSRDAKFPTLEKLQAQLFELSKGFDQVFLVMDALDEFEDRKLFLPCITSLVQDSSSNFKIFVTSRREKDIVDSFTKGGFPTIQIEAKKVDADIATFVRHQIEHRNGETSGFVISQELEEKIRNTLVSKSSGMFLWVKFQLDYIYGQPSRRDMEAVLDSLPSDMNATYIRILEKIDKGNPATRKIAKRALMWVVCAGRPLTLRELATAVSIEPEFRSCKEIEPYDGKVVLDACGNLLTAESGIVRPVHYTVQEFLNTSRSNFIDTGSSTILQKYRIVKNDAHIELARSCLQYLLFEEFGSANMTSPLWLWGIRGYSSFIRYAASSWDHHIRGISHLPQDLGVALDRLLDTKSTNMTLVYYVRKGLDGNELKFEMNPLIFCASFGLLNISHLSHQLDTTICDSKEHREALHHAAQDGSVSTIQALLDIGFAVQAVDSSGITPLYFAAERGHEAAVQMLLDKGADINAQGGKYGNALQAAADDDKEAVVQMLLDKGADVNAQGGKYGNALQAAAASGKEVVVQMLLDKGANINAQGGRYGNALQAAIDKGKEAVVQMLLDIGANANANAQGGKYGNALQAAAASGKEAVVQMLLDRGADVNAQGGFYGNALQAAADDDKEAVVQMLLDKGVDVNAQGGKYGNALQAAAASGKEAVVQMLLDKGADVNAQGGRYGNALQAAIDKGKEAVVQMLLDKGADANAQDGFYGNALQAAAASGKEEVVQMLLDKGADVHAQGGFYGNALQAAAASGKEAVVQMLLEKGADANAQGGEYGNALQAAAASGKEAVVQMHLDKGADVNAQGGKYDNTLQAAAASGKEAVVQMLLGKRADVNAQGGFYGNALQAAAASGKEAVVQMLLDIGANANAQGGFYGNALQVAAASGKETVVQMLLDKGADVNAQGGKYGNTLQAAAASGKEVVVQMLLDRGADVNAQGGEYGNALQAATSLRHDHLLQLLVKLGARGSKDEKETETHELDND